MKISKMHAFRKNYVNVIIETPKGSQNKFDYDPEYDIFSLKKTLPIGAVFPFDFGFIPDTKGEDGDPLDVLVIMDQPAYPGCHVVCRILGVLEAEQKEKDGTKQRNDRYVGVAHSSIRFKGIKNLKSLNASMVEEIEHFFIDYNKNEGKKFKPLGWKDREKALKLIKKAVGK
ncbi:MAG: inorganic diphosphatase [Bacteroidetes bacterium]|nr:inorganic diphosphatase [Bacteroidota bacterium]